MNAEEFYNEQEMGYENDSEDILFEYCAKDMIQFAEDYFIAKCKAENLPISNVVGQSEQLVCDCMPDPKCRIENNKVICNGCNKERK